MKLPQWLTPGIWGAVIGAIALAIIGFNWGGWTTQSAAEDLAQERSSAAVVAALTPFCVAQAQADADSAEMLAELNDISSNYQRRNFVSDAGWATLQGEDSANRDLATACAIALEELQPA